MKKEMTIANCLTSQEACFQPDVGRAYAGAGGFVIGTGVSLLNGESFGDALKAGGKGASLGVVTGVISLGSA